MWVASCSDSRSAKRTDRKEKSSSSRAAYQNRKRCSSKSEPKSPPQSIFTRKTKLTKSSSSAAISKWKPTSKKQSTASVLGTLKKPWASPFIKTSWSPTFSSTLSMTPMRRFASWGILRFPMGKTSSPTSKLSFASSNGSWWTLIFRASSSKTKRLGIWDSDWPSRKNKRKLRILKKDWKPNSQACRVEAQKAELSSNSFAPNKFYLWMKREHQILFFSLFTWRKAHSVRRETKHWIPFTLKNLSSNQTYRPIPQNCPLWSQTPMTKTNLVRNLSEPLSSI